MQSMFLDKNYWLDRLGLKEKEVPNKLVVYGSMFHSTILPLFEKFADIKKETGLPKIFAADSREGGSFLGGTVYAPTEAATMAHMAGVLNLDKIILVGSCGGLPPKTAPVLLPEKALREDGVSDWYLEGNDPVPGDKELLQKAHRHLDELELEHDMDTVTTINHMLMEKKSDINRWRGKAAGVDMETAAFYAVAAYFGVPATALLTKTEYLTEDTARSISKEEKKTIRENLLQTAIKKI